MVEARKKYENGLVKSSSPKKLYKYVNRNLNSKVSTITLKNPTFQQFLDSKSMVETFAEEFDTAFTKGSYPIPLLPDHSRVQNSIETIHFTAEKIEEALKNMKRDSSPGPDNIQQFFFKTVATRLVICF